MMQLRIKNYELRMMKLLLHLCLSVFVCGQISFVFAQSDRHLDG